MKPLNSINHLIPIFVIVIFALTLMAIIGQFAIVTYAGYSIISDPEGSAVYLGHVVSKAIEPIVDVIKD